MEPASKLTVRKAEPPVGTGGTKKKRLPAERHRKDITGQIGPAMEIPALKGG